jgi:hypothetical protein
VTEGLCLGMTWGLTSQSMRCDDALYVHDGPTHTDPSHDCAHLLVAANRGLTWKPDGDRDSIKRAEYNAVFVEHLLDEISTLQNSPHRALTRVKQYCDWFVDTHFAPFPVSAAEARRQFCAAMNVETIVRLSPHFFVMKRSEREGRRPFRRQTIELSFGSEDCPIADAETAHLQSLLREQLIALTASELGQFQAGSVSLGHDPPV